MPSLFSHFTILDNLINNYPISAKAKKVLKENEPYSYWGSVGPDYLFFYPADWNPVIKTFLEFYYTYDDLTEEVFAVFKSAKEIYSAPDDRLKDMVTGGVYGELQNTLSSLVTAFSARIAEFKTNPIDLFEIVTPPMHTKYTEQERKEWWWMDIAHHVKPMDFMRTLWNKAGSNEKFQAYAYGYLSHVGSDVIGHGYVNAVVGGPYRNHWRRHTLVEKCLDTHIWDYYFDGKSISNSQAYKRFHFDNAPYDFPKLPDDLADYISGCLKDTYSAMPIDSGIPGPEDIQLMYSYFYKWAKSASSKSLLNLPPPPPDFDWWDLPEELKNVLDSIGAAPTITNSPLPNQGDAKDWNLFFQSLFKFISWALKAIVTIIAIPAYILMRVATTPIRYIIWLLQKLIYEIYESSRIALSLAGLIHPEKKHLDVYFKNIISPNANHISEVFPFEKVFNDLQTYHLVHPTDFYGSQREEPSTKPFFNIPNFIPEKYFLDKLNTTALSDFEQSCLFANNANLPQLSKASPISTSDFSHALFTKFELDGGLDLPNWNLDVDRGLGWPEWFGNNNKPWTQFSDFKFPLC